MEEKINEVVDASQNGESNDVSENAENTYNVELLNIEKNKKHPGGVWAIISLVLALVSLGCALLNIIFAPLTIVSTLLLEITPFIHALFCLPALVLAILSIVFAHIAKKKGNSTKKAKLGFVVGIISTVVLGLSVLLMIVLGVIALVLAIVLGVLAALAGATFTSLLGVLTTLSPALAPILALVSSLLLAVAPVFVESFSDVAASEIIPIIVEFIKSLLESGVILLPQI